MSEEVLEPKLTRKEKRYAKLKAKYTNPVDIKFRGPLSYRALRIIAWIVFALGQLLVLNNVFSKLGWNFLGSGGEVAIDYISALAAPLFVVATFGVILSGQKTFKQALIFYGAAFVGMGLALIIFYYRYLLGIFKDNDTAMLIVSHMGFVVKANVFTDLFAFSLFHFFINYTPTKYFQDKKRKYFRMMAVIPVLYIIASYLIKTFSIWGYIPNLPFAVVPFLCTKSPLVFLVFAIVSIWIKFREKITRRIGLTKKEYEKFLKTNRNSLSYSGHLCTIIAIVVALEIVLIFILTAVYSHLDTSYIVYIISSLSIGQTIPLLLAIPFIMLYSYTRSHKNGLIDILLPAAGIGMTVIVYLEVIYHFFNR